MILELARESHAPGCTLGWLTVAGRKYPTIERLWVPATDTPAGRKGVSCVPLGTYKLERHNSDAHPRVWALVNPMLDVYHFEHEVPAAKRGIARTTCLIHAANWASELRGCIAPGKERVRDRSGLWRVERSRDAVNEIRSLVGASFDLSIEITQPESIERGGEFAGAGATGNW